MKSLVIDDEFISRKRIHKILSQYGECDQAASGAEALQAYELALAEGTPYDLITLDIILPDLHGVTVLKRIRKWEESKQIAERVKIVVVTVCAPQDAAGPAWSEKCDGYLEKPITKESMDQVLKTLKLG